MGACSSKCSESVATIRTNKAVTSRTRIAYLLNVSEDITTSVFRFLPSSELFCTISSCCQKWSKLVQEGRGFSSVNVSKFLAAGKDQKHIVKFLAGTQKVTVKTLEQVEWLSTCQQLRALTISLPSNWGDSPKRLATKPFQLPNSVHATLQVLDMQNVGIGDVSAESVADTLSKLPALTRLHIDKALVKENVHMESVTELTIGEWHTWRIWKVDFLREFPNLTTLDMSTCPIAVTELPVLEQLPCVQTSKLQSLSLWLVVRTSSSKGPGPAVPKLTQVPVVTLELVPNIDDQDAPVPEWLATVFPNTRVLGIGTKSPVHSLAPLSHLKHVHTLQLECIDPVTDDAVRFFPPTITNLILMSECKATNLDHLTKLHIASMVWPVYQKACPAALLRSLAMRANNTRDPFGFLKIALDEDRTPDGEIAEALLLFPEGSLVVSSPDYRLNFDHLSFWI